MDKSIHIEVQDYYGKKLKNKTDLQTNACCTSDAVPNYLKPVLAKIHPEVMEKYYGCGLVAPELLEGKKILDLGSGSGRDAYALAQLVGETGEVVGVDMTDKQLEVANKHIEYHRKKFGFKKSNVRFVRGYIEKLDKLGFEENYFDIIISNCVINLSPDKPAVFNSAFKLLKPGGEMYFSDVYSERRIPEELIKDPVLYGECLSGALYWNDFIRVAKKAGFMDPRLVTHNRLTINNPEIEKKVRNYKFYSATYRLFKIADLESACEDYGQAVIYKGTIPENPFEYSLDNHHLIEKEKVFLVCGNTYRMLNETRFKNHFDFIGNWNTHYGIFSDCGNESPFNDNAGEVLSAGCC